MKIARLLWPAIALVLTQPPTLQPQATAPSFDVIIRNGRIVDGTGSPWFHGDIGILDGRITAVGTVKGAAKQIVDVAGLVVAPGFIDMLGQSEFNILVDN